jgi:hypothetical protein
MVLLVFLLGTAQLENETGKLLNGEPTLIFCTPWESLVHQQENIDHLYQFRQFSPECEERRAWNVW